MRRGLVLGTALLACVACSERDDADLEWLAQPIPEKVGFRAVAVWSASAGLAVGYDQPERSLLARAVCYRRQGDTWSRIPVPGHEHEFFQLLDVAAVDDGTAWACGVVRALAEDPATARGVVYRYAAGAWTEVDLGGLGADREQAALEAVAVLGTGPDIEVRTAGRRQDGTGVVLRLAQGVWSRMPLAPPPVAEAWWLGAIEAAADGRWIAAGGLVGDSGGVLYVDDSGGWRRVPGPAIDAFDITAVAFDADAVPWFAGNHPSGEFFQGRLFRWAGGGFEETPIRRTTPGPARFFALAFDHVGRGWVGGGRAPDEPFVAGNAAGPWIEARAEAEGAGGYEEYEEGEEEVGGDIHGLSLLSRAEGVAVGLAAESGPEGYIEFLPRLFHLQRKPPGEIDARTPFDPIE